MKIKKPQNRVEKLEVWTMIITASYLFGHLVVWAVNHG